MDRPSRSLTAGGAVLRSVLQGLSECPQRGRAAGAIVATQTLTHTPLAFSSLPVSCTPLPHSTFWNYPLDKLLAPKSLSQGLLWGKGVVKIYGSSVH